MLKPKVEQAQKIYLKNIRSELQFNTGGNLHKYSLTESSDKYMPSDQQAALSTGRMGKTYTALHITPRTRPSSFTASRMERTAYSSVLA